MKPVEEELKPLIERAEYRKINDYLYGLFIGQPIPEIMPKEMKIIEERENYFFELLEFFIDMEKDSIKFDLMMGDIKQWQADNILEAQTKIPDAARELFKICKTGRAVFNSTPYIRSFCREYNSVGMLKGIKNMLYFLK